MKKLSFLIILTFLIVSNIFGQNFKLGFDIGYGLGHNNFTIGDGNVTLLEDYNTIKEIASHSYGKGNNFGLTVEYQFDDFLSSYMSISKLNSTKEKVINKFLNSENLYTYDAKCIRLVTGVKSRYNIDNKSYLFLHLGLVLSLLNEIEKADINFSKEREVVVKYMNGESFGLSGGIGYFYEINTRLNFSADIRFYSHSYSPDNGEVVKYIIDGQDKLNELEISDRYVNFVERIDGSDGNNDQNKPSKYLKMNYSFGSIGLNITLLYDLCSKD